MARDPRAFLWDASQASDAIVEFTRGLDAESYKANALVRSAVERQFEIIGEALNKLSRLFPDVARQIPDVAEIVSFRNLLIHGYAAIDDARVWGIAQTSLPELRSVLARMINDPGDS